MSLRLSGLQQLVGCPGSLEAQAGFEDNVSNKYMRYGTHGHLCMEHTVPARRPVILPHEDYVDNDQFDLLGDVERMWTTVDTVIDCHGGWDKASHIRTERQVTLILSDSPRSFDTKGKAFIIPGTLDLSVYFADKKKLVIFDYKFGKGYVPCAKENFQLGGYGLAAVQEAEKTGLEIEKVDVNLITLGTGHSSYVYDMDEMMDLHDLLYVACDRATSEGAEQIVGSHCKFCKAFLTDKCDISRKVPGAIVKYGNQPAKLSIEVAAKVLSLKETINKGMEQCEEKVREALEMGQDVGGLFYLGNASTYKEITDQPRLEYKAQAMGIKLPQPKVRLNWTDIEKQIRSMLGVTAREAKEIMADEFGDCYRPYKGKRPLKKA